MPANTIVINGSEALIFTLGDSKMPLLIKYLQRYCYENLRDGDGQIPVEDVPVTEEKAIPVSDTIFAEFMTELAKVHYGEDFEFESCLIEKEDDGTSVVTWERQAKT